MPTPPRVYDPKGGRPPKHGGEFVFGDARRQPRRPWERPAPPNKLTPARVRRGFRNLRTQTGSPAGSPKPSTPGPGRPPGSKNRRPATRHDVGRVLATGAAYSRPAHHKKATKPRRTVTELPDKTPKGE
ncbi:hypothetical protein GCM10010251_93940 [Streptomyces aurantiogriseus]|uniref:Uncharacterized protein n=1 Tax=Streptomyces aurantiogriseus TaxID=66870 RepID=A0A918FP50_9ACTN|nr:hypothetical protein GCM10010251_93940 [Streptomyces aurantiogriseus]